MQVAGSFSADGVSAALRVGGNESLTLVLSTAGADTFIGTVLLERTEKNGPWSPVVDTSGVPVSFTGVLSAELGPGAVASVTVKNGPRDARYRVRVFGFDDDDLDFVLADVADDVVATLVTDRNGNPVMQLLDNGGVRMRGKLEVEGAIEGESTLSVAGQVSEASGEVVERVIEGTISAADIIATGAGKFGHAAGYPMVPAVGADEAVEFVSAVVVNDRAVAAYTGGGNVTVNLSGGGAAQSGLVAAAAFLGAATDTQHVFRPLTTVAVPLVAGAGLNLVAASAFTNPGTAAGVIRYRVRYRVHQLNLA